VLAKPICPASACTAVKVALALVKLTTRLAALPPLTVPIVTPLYWTVPAVTVMLLPSTMLSVSPVWYAASATVRLPPLNWLASGSLTVMPERNCSALPPSV